jgi:hypothetical protein
LGSTADWQAVSDGIVTNGENRVLTLQPAGSSTPRFFRLKQE